MALLNAQGWYATFRHTLKGVKGEDKPYNDRQRVVCWLADEGETPVGLIYDEDRKCLRSAEAYNNFTGYKEDDWAGSTIIPAHPGWWVEWLDGDQVGWYESVVAWVIGAKGFGIKGIVGPDPDDLGCPVEADEHRRFVYDPARQPMKVAPKTQTQQPEVA
jgi:hypothetical protein